MIAALNNVSAFPAIPDRLQQGLLDELYLGRIMISSTGFSTAPAFHQDGTLATGSVLNTAHLFYNGNSQGGIMGGALTAISPDFTRASLGVPAMNYSVLIPRSVDFRPFEIAFAVSYPGDSVRPLLLDLMQMLWDRGEPDGYADRMTTNPLPDTPAHQVLMDVAFGDHQVTDYEADVEARTIGASAHFPILYPRRWPGAAPLWDVPHLKSYPFTGSAVYYWDIGPVRESPGSVPGKRSVWRRRPTRTRPTKKARIPTNSLAARRPSSRWSRTSSKARFRPVTTVAARPASRAASKGRRARRSAGRLELLDRRVVDRVARDGLAFRPRTC